MLFCETVSAPLVLAWAANEAHLIDRSSLSLLIWSNHCVLIQWSMFPGVDKFTPTSDHAILRESRKTPKSISQKLQVRVRIWNVHDGTIIKKTTTTTTQKKTVLVARRTLSFYKEQQHGLGLQSCILTNHKTSEIMFLVHTKPKWSSLATVNDAMFGKYQTQHIRTNTSCEQSSMVVEGWWFRLVLHQTWAPYSHRVSYTFCCIPKYSRDKFEAICLTAEA